MLTRRIKQGDLGNTLALSCVERLLLYIFEDNKINQEYTQLIEYKEQNIFKKILSKIMKLFKKNN